jgi:hypothetical protein
VLESWLRHYNTARAHGSLGYKPPAPEVFIPATPPALASWPSMNSHSKWTSQRGLISQRRDIADPTLAQCVSSSANLSLTACLRPLTIPNAHLSSCSESTFACSIAQIPLVGSEILVLSDSGEQPDLGLAMSKSERAGGSLWIQLRRCWMWGMISCMVLRRWTTSVYLVDKRKCMRLCDFWDFWGRLCRRKFSFAGRSVKHHPLRNLQGLQAA